MSIVAKGCLIFGSVGVNKLLMRGVSFESGHDGMPKTVWYRKFCGNSDVVCSWVPNALLTRLKREGVRGCWKGIAGSCRANVDLLA